jgi:hypothetical protein
MVLVDQNRKTVVEHEFLVRNVDVCCGLLPKSGGGENKNNGEVEEDGWTCVCGSLRLRGFRVSINDTKGRTAKLRTQGLEYEYHPITLKSVRTRGCTESGMRNTKAEERGFARSQTCTKNTKSCF